MQNILSPYIDSTSMPHVNRLVQIFVEETDGDDNDNAINK